MNTKKWTLFIMALALVFISGQAMAQPPAQQQPGAQQQFGTMSPGTQLGMDQKTHRASELIGEKVEGSQGQELGKIKDIVFSDTGEIDFIVLSKEDKLIPIPFQAAELSKEQDKITFKGVDEQKLQNAPSLSEGEWQRLEDRQFEDQVRSYYEPGTTPGQRPGAMPGQPGQLERPGAMPGQPGQPGQAR
jgi:sporulation protein YlmC with PRC-barrel domain